jgi:hypothetical protein
MMHERIVELRKQCIVREQRGTTAFDSYMVDRFDTERFAKLIVKECAGIYDKIDNGNLHMGTDNYLEALQKHFGV